MVEIEQFEFKLTWTYSKNQRSVKKHVFMDKGLHLVTLFSFGYLLAFGFLELRELRELCGVSEKNGSK